MFSDYKNFNCIYWEVYHVAILFTISMDNIVIKENRRHEVDIQSPIASEKIKENKG